MPEIKLGSIERFLGKVGQGPMPASKPEVKVAVKVETEKPEKFVTAKEADTPSDLKIPTFMMNFPFTLEIGQANNAWMKKGVKLDYEKAFSQWLALYNFLAGNALVYVLPSTYEMQDLPYVANLGCFLPHLKKETIILARMKSPPRQGEEPIGEAFFKLLKYRVAQSPLYFEGEAELKYLYDNNYVLGYGQRTDIENKLWMERNFGMNVITLKETNQKMYHLDCVIFPLTKDKTIACVDVILPEELKKLEKYTEIIPINKKMGEAGTTNCVRCRNMVLCGSSLNEIKENTDDYKEEHDKVDFLNRICSDNGLETVIFNLSEMEKSGAALSCNIMNFNYTHLTNKVVDEDNNGD